MSDRGGNVVRLPAAPIEVLRPFYPSTIDGPPPAPRWIVDGLLLPGSVCLLTGAPGVGKSLLTQQLMTAIALGQPWLGKATEQARCFALFCEDGRDPLTRRQIALCEHHDVDTSALDQEFSWEDREDRDATLWDVDPRSRIGKPTVFWHQLWSMVADEGIRVVGIDTAATTFSGNENFRTDVTPYMRALTREAVRNNCAVVLNAHPSRGNPNGYSGSSAWLASCRLAVSLGRPKEYDELTGEPRFLRVLRGLKSNYSAGFRPENLRLDHGVFVLDGDDAERAAKHGPLNHVERQDMRYRLIAGLKRAMLHGVLCPADVLASRSLPNLARAYGDPEISRIALNEMYAGQTELLEAGQLVMVRVGAKILIRPHDGPYYPNEEPFIPTPPPGNGAGR